MSSEIQIVNTWGGSDCAHPAPVARSTNTWGGNDARRVLERLTAVKQ